MFYGKAEVSCLYLLSGMDIINETLQAAVSGKDKNDWTPVSVNVAPATLTILSKKVKGNRLNMTWAKGKKYSDFNMFQCNNFHVLLSFHSDFPSNAVFTLPTFTL